jgi:hypothetical protein
MIDTFQISKTFLHPPKASELERNGWKPLRDKHTGEPTALCCNSAKGEPRLTQISNLITSKRKTKRLVNFRLSFYLLLQYSVS